MPCARWQWTRCSRPTAGIPVRRWAWPRWPPHCGTHHLRHNPDQSALGRPRPLRAQQRPRLDADLRTAAPHRLRPADERVAQLPAAAQQDARAPGSRHHPRCRDHHRPARPGRDQRGRHGAGREAAGNRIQPARPHHRRPPHLCVPGRRLPDGRHQPRGLRAGRRLEAQQADRPVRRQRHQHRRPGGALVHRRHAQAFRGLRLERDRARWTATTSRPSTRRSPARRPPIDRP